MQGIHPKGSSGSQVNPAQPGEPPTTGRGAQPTQAPLLHAEGGTAASLMSESLVLQPCTAVQGLWMPARGFADGRRRSKSWTTDAADVAGGHRNAAATTSGDVRSFSVSPVNLPEEVCFVRYVHRPHGQHQSRPESGGRWSPRPRLCQRGLGIEYISLVLKKEK